MTHKLGPRVWTRLGTAALALTAAVLLLLFSAVLIDPPSGGPAMAAANPCGAGGAQMVNGTCRCPDAFETRQTAEGLLRCVIKCPIGQQPAPGGKTCVTAAPKCRGDMVAVNGVCACPAGKTPGAKPNQCVTACGGGSKLVNGVCSCVPPAVDMRGVPGSGVDPKGPIKCVRRN